MKHQDRLHAELAEAERRREAELTRTGRKASYIFGLPVLLCLIWAGVFLLRYQPGPDKSAEVPKSAESLIPTQPTEADPEYGAFMPKSGAANEKGGLFGNGQIVDKDDIRFATELLNFCQTPKDNPDDAKHDGSPPVATHRAR